MSTPSNELQTVMSAVLKEKRRLRTLSNEDLVREYLKLEAVDAEILVEEMCSRLWVDWHKGEEDR